VVIQQNSRKLLMMDILMSETCWAPKKWNKIASDIKLVFYSSTITMMHGQIYRRFRNDELCLNILDTSPCLYLAIADKIVRSDMLIAVRQLYFGDYDTDLSWSIPAFQINLKWNKTGPIPQDN